MPSHRSSSAHCAGERRSLNSAMHLDDAPNERDAVVVFRCLAERRMNRWPPRGPTCRSVDPSALLSGATVDQPGGAIGRVMPEFDAAYFETNYADYEGQNPERKLRHYHEVIRRRWVASGATVVDIGCGLGMWADHLARSEPGWSVVGMDVDPDVIKRNADRYPGVRFEVGRAGEGESTEEFDILTAMDVLEHVPGVETRFRDICRGVRKGGLLAFVVPVYDGPLGPAVRLLDRDPTHIHKWSRDRWLELAHSELSGVEWHGIFRLRLPGGHYVHQPSDRLRQMAPAIMVSGFVGGTEG